MEERELARMFESGAIADDPDQSHAYESDEEWLAKREYVLRVKRLRELIRASKEEGSSGSR